MKIDQTTTCSRCDKEYKYKRNCTTTLCRSCARRERRQKKKLKMIEMKGGECVYCGYKKCPQALQFHHLEPEKKRFSMYRGIDRNWKEIKKELEKCELVCANCHAEIHSEEIVFI
jgi:hypothetical protein